VSQSVLAIAALVAILVVAVATALAAWSAARAAKVARDSLEEVRQDRELQLAPYLTLEWGATGPDGQPAARLRNLGRGPAIGAVLITGNKRQGVRMTTRVDIGAGQVGAVGLVLLSHVADLTFPKALFAEPDTPYAAEGSVMFCTSITRTAVYRFRHGAPADEPWYLGQEQPYWAPALLEFAPTLVPAPLRPLPDKASPPAWPARMWSRVRALPRWAQQLPLRGGGAGGVR